jgi:hypothetical protein
LDKRLERTPQVSVIVVVFNIPREIRRTLHSLSAAYQRHIERGDYEVIVVDNGSTPPFDPHLFADLPGTFRLIRVDNASPSPARAINLGLAEARGDVIGVMIDGARMVTPGLLHFAHHGAQLFDNAVVATLGWYLGFDFQRWAMASGHNHAREDSLLASIEWPLDGYRLFEISTLDESSVDGWLQPIAESNALFMRRRMWDLLGGLDEAFDEPGGGLLNHHTFRRALELPGAELVLLLGEGTFHQFHNGVATNAPAEQAGINWTHWVRQYESICQRRYEWPRAGNAPTYLGSLPRAALNRFARAALNPLPRANVEPIFPDSQPLESPLGHKFNRELWSLSEPEESYDPMIAALIDLMHREFRAGHEAAAAGVARLIRERAPGELEPQRVLSLLAAWPPQLWDTNYSLALADAHGLLGENELAASLYRNALSLNGDLARAHAGLASLLMPGDCRNSWLDRFFTVLSPEIAIVIGIGEGGSLARVRPPTRAIGIGPNPSLTCQPKAETHIFPESSDAFFARGGLDELLGQVPLGVAVIDGSHLFEQALRDFIHLEPYCGPRSVILLPNTVPLDEATQSRVRHTQFHTGDVWKTVLCLKHFHSDLEVFTIPTPLTGLTVVTGFGAQARVPADRYDEAVARFIDLPFSAVENCLDSALNLVANDWPTVRTRLRTAGIL